MNILRSPIFKNGDGPWQGDSVARRRFAWALIDLLDWVGKTAPQSFSASSSLVTITKSQWSRIQYGKAPPFEDAESRTWERWKRKLRGLGLAAQINSDDHSITLLAPLAKAWAEENAGELPAPTGKIERTLSTKQLADRISISPRVIVPGWICAGVPFTRGKQRRFLFNEEEVRAWLASRLDESRRAASHYEERIPSSEAAARLKVVMDGLGMPVKELARALKVPSPTLRTWLTGAAETTPLSVVTYAEDLLAEAGVDPGSVPEINRERLRASSASPRLEVVRKKLNLSISGIARELGVPHATMKSWLHGTSATVPAWAVEKAEGLLARMQRAVSKHVDAKVSDEDKIRRAFVEAGGSPVRAAKALGISRSYARELAKKLGIVTPKRVILSEVLSASDVRRALEESGGNAGIAAKKAGVDRNSLLRLVEKHGLGDLVRRGRPETIRRTRIGGGR